MFQSAFHLSVECHDKHACQKSQKHLTFILDLINRLPHLKDYFMAGSFDAGSTDTWQYLAAILLHAISCVPKFRPNYLKLNNYCLCLVKAKPTISLLRSPLLSFAVWVFYKPRGHVHSDVKENKAWSPTMLPRGVTWRNAIRGGRDGETLSLLRKGLNFPRFRLQPQALTARWWISRIRTWDYGL